LQIPRGFIHPHHALKPGLQEFVDGFNFPISLRILRGWFFMTKTQLSPQFTHHMVLEMGSMISYNSLLDCEMSDDVIEHKKCCNSAIVKKCRHSLNPFIEIIDCDDNITIPPVEVGLHCMKSIPPFAKGSMETIGWSGAGWVRATLILKDLIGWVFFNGLNAIFEYGRRKITIT
jgi:hypothetical protein